MHPCVKIHMEQKQMHGSLKPHMQVQFVLLVKVAKSARKLPGIDKQSPECMLRKPSFEVPLVHP